MATIGNEVLTLVDYAKRLTPDGSVETQIAELLTETNEILTDMPWMEANQTTGHRTTIRTGLPTVTWGKLNAGIPASKSTTVQVDESIGMLEGLSKVDERLLKLGGNEAATRMSEAVSFIDAMNEEFAGTVFYGDDTTAPEEFLGLAPRFSTISGATNGQNVLSGGGAGSDNTSIWLVGYGPQSFYGIFPKGSKAGLDRVDLGTQLVDDDSGNHYTAKVEKFTWSGGVCLKDWRYVVRIPNIDVSNLIAESSAADLLKLMYRALYRLPSFSNCKPVFYCNRTVMSMIGIQGLGKSSGAVKVEEALNQFGKPQTTTTFLGVPVRICDQILNTEATIS